MSEEDVDKCAHNVEGEMFSFFGDTGHRYKNKYRSLMFNLKDPRNKVRQTLSSIFLKYLFFLYNMTGSRNNFFSNIFLNCYDNCNDLI